MAGDYQVTIPADIEKPDKILAGLTARQLAILIPASVGVWLIYVATHSLVPLPVFAVFAVVALGGAAGLALVERDGIGLDRLLFHALRQQHEPRHLVLAPEGLPPLPAWATAASGTSRDRGASVQPTVVPLRLPARGIRPDGVIEVGASGVAVLVACSTVSFALRTPGEQAGLVEAFGGWLNSLIGPGQILVHATPINLAPTIEVLHQQAPALPHPALEAAAHDHAEFLTELATTRELLSRQVLLVLREPGGPTTSSGANGAAGVRGQDVDGAAKRVLRRAEQAIRALAAAGINATVLDAGQATAALAQAADPGAPPMEAGRAAPGEVVTSTSANPPLGRARRRSPRRRKERRR